jgi:hypothetical protein
MLRVDLAAEKVPFSDVSVVLRNRLGFLRIARFPGMLGVEVAKSRAQSRIMERSTPSSSTSAEILVEVSGHFVS